MQSILRCLLNSEESLLFVFLLCFLSVIFAKLFEVKIGATSQVFSKSALGAYLSQHQRCEHSLPFWSWGEDRRG